VFGDAVVTQVGNQSSQFRNSAQVADRFVSTDLSKAGRTITLEKARGPSGSESAGFVFDIEVVASDRVAILLRRRLSELRLPPTPEGDELVETPLSMDGSDTSLGQVHSLR
jgi:hypothetical protein